MKRLFDIVCSLVGLLILSPLLLISLFLVWRQDFHSPFYIANRVGKNGKSFKLIKIRSMIINADSSGVDSTSADDNRITKIGLFVRKYKVDEIPQLVNVLFGKMSLVGPRPNVVADVNLYTDIEKGLLKVRPGITDISSIVFSDEGDILAGCQDPDLKYNQVIRPWKSRLGLLYIQKENFFLDIYIILITIIAIFKKPLALNMTSNLLSRLGADATLISVCKRDAELLPYPPPGSDELVSRRESL